MFEMFLGTSDVVKDLSDMIVLISLNVEIYEDWLRNNLKSPFFAYIQGQVQEAKSEITNIQYLIQHLLRCGYKPHPKAEVKQDVE